jgi:histidine ammonia-lyase
MTPSQGGGKRNRAAREPRAQANGVIRTRSASKRLPPERSPVRAAAELTLGDGPLTLAQLDACLHQPLRVRISPDALDRVQRARAWVEALESGDEPVYGINTGVGHLKNRRIPRRQLDQLQENLIVSHAVGVGPPAPPEIVRWMMLLKLHMLLAGHSGVRAVVVQRLADWLSADLLPVVPTRGSLGASGDLAPLAHLVLPLIGRGDVRHPRIDSAPPPEDAQTSAESSGSLDHDVPCEHLSAAEANRRLGVRPLRLAAKEGLALINGTQFMAAYAAHIAVRARRLADLADLIACMSLEGLRGSVRPADERLHRLRPHPGALIVAANVRRHMRDSEILKSHEHCGRVQDAYSLRCVPQVHGAFREALEHFCAVIEREMNAVTDNPVLVETNDEGEHRRRAGPEERGRPARHANPERKRGGNVGSYGLEAHTTSTARFEAISGGNFHGAPLALVLDYLAIALTDLASISERRIYLLLSGLDGLPELLMQDTGLNSGFMLPQYTAAALLNECKVLAAPASIDSIPTSLGQEDHVSMGATAALKCYEILDRVETVLAIEMMCASQALDFRAPLKPGVGPRAAHAVVRRHITHAEADREFGTDIRTALRLLRDERSLRDIARG